MIGDYLFTTLCYLWISLLSLFNGQQEQGRVMIMGICWNVREYHPPPAYWDPVGGTPEAINMSLACDWNAQPNFGYLWPMYLPIPSAMRPRMSDDVFNWREREKKTRFGDPKKLVVVAYTAKSGI